MRNLHQLLLQEDGIEAWRLFRLWEKLQLRASEYKNHRIFTLRCIHNDLVPSSIKLKSTFKSTRANQILRKVEKDLLQARVKSINFILDQTSRQLEECRSKLATIVSTQKLRECQDFVDKVSETRFNKVKLRQLNTLNLLTIRKEGNITRSNNTNTNNLASCTNNLASCNNSQANTPQGRNHSFPGQPSFSGKYPPREGTVPSQASTSPPLALALPSGEASAPPASAVSAQAAALPPGEASVSLASALPSQASTSLPPALALPPREANTSQATALPSGGASTSPASVLPSQASTTLPPALALPPGEASAPPAPTLPPNTREGITPSQANTPLRPLLTLTPLGPPRQVKLAIQLGLPGKAIGTPPTIGQLRLPRRSTPPPRKETHPSPPVGLPKVLPRKNLTLSGSLTFPTNP